MITIRPGSPAASLVASITAQRQLSKPSPCVKARRGLTTELPTRFRRPLIMRQAVAKSAATG
jgi:hypothetical protein